MNIDIEENLTQKEKYYPDVIIFLIAIPIISAINFHLTYTNIQANSFYLVRFLIDTAQGYIAWWAVRLLIINLDTRIPFEPDPARRILLQTILTTFTGVLLIALTTEALSLMIKKEWAPFHFYSKDLLIISIWFLVINGFYIGMYFYRQWKEKKVFYAQGNSKPCGFPVKKGNQVILVWFEEISMFLVDAEYILLIDSAGKKFLMDLSLDKIEKKVPGSDFFRLNRQVIANKKIIKGFKKIENGKLLIQLIESFDLSQDLIVSRTKASSFRSWFLN
ncbi:putative two-component response regulator [Indibacter alkaliphilus LW1]|uniref:Two-component response regulator n=1 Tax=Indibacter alkaliphilus (strain CCUG 57479 / KCTC 22604 / LW1) TaxID=1189612 RepID=S2DKV4_INDAL|nr:LytTR family DNA-binding domain-containing protein [Indibacter alkaliphilus]EOZ92586.1 putative two-component response regulator [Indibacter alkaliphilus LW1]